MKPFGIILVISSLWMAFEIWRAPLMEQKDDGRFVIKRPEKNLSDLFKKKNKNQQLWMFKLQTVSQNH